MKIVGIDYLHTGGGAMEAEEEVVDNAQHSKFETQRTAHKNKLGILFYFLSSRAKNIKPKWRQVFARHKIR